MKTARRLARLLYGTRVSLALAPAAALLACVAAALVGGLAGLAGGWADRAVLAAVVGSFQLVVPRQDYSI
ncbi:MAG TPA: hypothetical protein VLH09_13570 [Bryobacteraceae bacterium]|nr:hypothetical protein [Bryobacteraceae bacterium]